jgi:phage baseplate assembly protein V
MESPIAQSESPYEILRRLEGLIRIGTIAAVRHARPARCRVRSGDLTTNWIPWLTLRAAGQNASTWWPPAVGEQCLLLSPGGDTLAAVALTGIYSSASAQPSDRAEVCRTQWNATDFMEHDGSTGHLHIEAAEGITLRVGDSVLSIDRQGIRLSAAGGSAVVDGRGLSGAPDVTTGSISLLRHRHGGVEPGRSATQEPL